MDTVSMVFVSVLSLQMNMLEAELVRIEVDISRGLNHFSIVGFAGKAIDEAKERVSVAIKNCGFVSPLSKNNKTIISLAPADLRKEGPHFDVALALAYLLAVDDIRFDPSGRVFVGELSLDGSIRPVKMVLAYVMGAKQKGMKEIYIPYENATEVGFISGIEIFPIKSLRDIIGHLNTKRTQAKDDAKDIIPSKTLAPIKTTPYKAEDPKKGVDFSEVKGQENAKRALEISASGRHNVMLYGPPGTGKSMLAKAFSYLLPSLTLEECIEVSSIHNSLGMNGVVSNPPFRSPHHTATLVSLLGGGAVPRAGEITLAHRGTLFLDELPEFSRQVIDSLRQPLEDKAINVSRARGHVAYPADFILIASMNLCPCGYAGSLKKECVCSDAVIATYQKKISGPIIDRIDMWVSVSEVEYEKFQSGEPVESSETIKKRVEKVREKRVGLKTEDEPGEYLLQKECADLLRQSAERLALSPRAYHRVIKVARTIAYMESKAEIEKHHILEALQYRPKF